MNTNKVCRSSKDKVICGVCGGLAEYWDVSVFWVRIAALVAFIMWFPLSILVYFVCCWLMPRPELYEMQVNYHRSKNSQKTGGSAFRTQADAYHHVSSVFDAMESRICKMEDKVTSKEFILNQKFQNL